MSSKFNEFVDEYQHVHLQDKILGQGGQGVVFRTQDPDLAIKLVTDETGNPITDKNSVTKYSERFKRVRLLPLPENLNISIPVVLLQNHAGYVMQLLSEMIPFSHFWLDGKSAKSIATSDIPKWLSEVPEGKAKEIVHYYKTGGLRHRLNTLHQCASLLARLHGNGMVYGDISPNNIFISEGFDNSLVWLIDADNIRFEVSSNGSSVYTPKYGAPELVQGKDSGNPSSDCHAFAVVAFYALSLIHPFVGKKVDGTDGGDWADAENDNEDVEEKAYAGLLPWVDDLLDDSNSSESGLPRSLLLTKKLAVLFQATFGQGRTSPWLRPTIYHWPEALAQAADTTVKCPECSMSYFDDFVHPETNEYHCPYCKAERPPLLVLESYRWCGANKTLDASCWRYVREISLNSTLSIPRRVFDDFTMLDSDTAEILIYLTEKEILIEKLGSDKAEFSVAIENHAHGAFQKLYSKVKIDRKTQEETFWMFSRLNSARLIQCSIIRGAT